MAPTVCFEILFHSPIRPLLWLNYCFIVPRQFRHMAFVETGNWVCHPWKEWKKLSAIRESKKNLVASCRALSYCHFRRANRGRRWLDSRTTCWLWRTTTTPWRQNWTACSTWRWGTFTLSQQKTSPNSTLSFVLGVNSDHQGPLALIMLFVTYVYDLLSRTKAEARSLVDVIQLLVDWKSQTSILWLPVAFKGRCDMILGSASVRGKGVYWWKW